MIRGKVFFLMGFLLKALAFLYTIGVTKNVNNMSFGKSPKMTEHSNARYPKTYNDLRMKMELPFPR